MAIFPSRVPIGVILGAVSALAAAPAIFGVWHHRQSPLEAFYLPSYAKAHVQLSRGLLTGKPIPHSFYLVTVNGTYAVPETMPADMRGVSGRFVNVQPSAYAAWLKLAIYHGQGLGELIETPLLLWGMCAIAAILTGAICDFRRRRDAREGELLRGPSMMTIAQFNRTTKQKGKEKGFALFIKV